MWLMQYILARVTVQLDLNVWTNFILMQNWTHGKSHEMHQES